MTTVSFMMAPGLDVSLVEEMRSTMLLCFLLHQTFLFIIANCYQDSRASAAKASSPRLELPSLSLGGAG